MIFRNTFIFGRRGVCILSRDGQVISCNISAKEIFQAADGMSVRNNYIHAAVDREDIRLKKLITDVADDRYPEGIGIRLSRLSEACAYIVLLMPFSRRRCDSEETIPGTLVFIIDSDAKYQPNIKILQDIYEFTNREAMLAAILASGVTIKDATEKMGIGIGTARTHLRTIFSKTDTRRQAELVLLMAKLTI